MGCLKCTEYCAMCVNDHPYAVITGMHESLSSRQMGEYHQPSSHFIDSLPSTVSTPSASPVHCK